MKVNAAQAAKRMTHPEVTLPTYRARRGRHHPLVRPPVERVSRRCRPAPETATQRRLPRLWIRVGPAVRATGTRRDSPARTRRGPPACTRRGPPARDIRCPYEMQDIWRHEGRMHHTCPTGNRCSCISYNRYSRGIQFAGHPMPATSDSRDTRPPTKCRTPSDTSDGCVPPASVVTGSPAFRTIATDSTRRAPSVSGLPRESGVIGTRPGICLRRRREMR